MKIELHLHTSRYSLCALNTPKEMISRLVKLGYEAVFLTEHDAVWDEKELEELQGRFPLIKIFPGLELTLLNKRGFCHLLILGTKDPTFLEMTDAGAVLGHAHRQGHLTVLAHPSRWDGASEIVAQGYYPDAMEYHSPNQDALQADMSRESAERLHLPLVNSGDAHGVDFLGRFWIETPHPVDSAGSLRRMILDGNYKNCTGI